MTLDNINQIIDAMNEDRKNKIDGQNYKNNFENVIKQKIEIESGSSRENITKAEIDDYISNITSEELIRNIKTAGAYRSSLKRDKNYDKEEYKKIVSDIEKINYHKAQMKG